MSIIITNETVKELFHIAQRIAQEHYNSEYSGAHLLQGLMHRDIDLIGFLESLGKDVGYIYEWADVRIEECPTVGSFSEQVTPNESIERVLQEADELRVRLGLDEITPICILAAVVKPQVAFSLEQLKSLPLREHEIINHLSGQKSPTSVLNSFEQNNNTIAFSVLNQYCIDKTAQARSESIDKIIGREKETRSLIEVLCRRSKPNVLIVGEPGVGKTALVEGFANEIIKGRVPTMLKNAVLLELDTSLLMAGTSYKGEIEDRMKKVINECKKLDKAILFIDEIHSVVDSKGNMNGVANLLKPELARGEITLIGATTFEEYRKIIEPEQAFNRRFEVLPILEPDTNTAIKMVEVLLENYQLHHQIEVDKEAIPECIRLAKRYAKGKKLPDAAIDLLDRTMAAIKMLDELSLQDLDLWKQDYDIIKQQKDLNEDDKIFELQWIYTQLQNRISPILWGSLKEQPQIETSYNSIQIEELIDKVYDELKEYAAIKREKVGKLELAAVMAAKTGIPIGKIQAQEKEKMLNMESHLLKRVVGQDHALKILADAIVENRSGLGKAGQPIGSFFFLGPTGTGKTELAKSIAELLFNDEKAMIRFDMSEFKEEHSAALLYGAPPGYVGYEEGGMLVNKIRQQPYAVVLFDEIEKAHSSVFDVFLQIMDEGKISDKLGKEGDFSNALILFTSNIGSADIIEKFTQHHIPTSSELMQLMSGHFRPEFLARITEIIPFAPITEVMAEKIFGIQLQPLIDALSRQGITLTVCEQAKKKLAITGFSSKYGARQIAGVIRTRLTRPISKKIVSEEIKYGNHIHITWNDEQDDIFWEVK
ncbi:ATP-dependent Clp protease ATP-binding subunit [Capnocytophaga canimorsus]|uniref:ATP-dependent Clp protease ATP-binding subunit n=1 Tax=Capnocytophaga canimorsus TaxID=28188 RepID=UPI000D6E2919|nr:ATP-dependent Clp protease ATP-binding subunit [Capnocytophaga canimorsus]AWL78000.1 type VI secretion system ATPase ClpV [Capnocytophaga canimorsus]AYW36635.1 ATP-dependent Clp protease ATP-binding subunit [Capnocytophaga canimorsus]MDT9499304.1 ATP-dependent Clp protease ATP-binding subunit [Capnocytophaga canimorsus]